MFDTSNRKMCAIMNIEGEVRPQNDKGFNIDLLAWFRPLDGLQGGIMKKKILAMTLLLAIMASMLVFAACKDDEPDEPKKLLGGFGRRTGRTQKVVGRVFVAGL